MRRDCETHRRTIDCHQLAEFYQSVDRNHVEAGKLFREMCLERNHGASCLQAGIQHLSGKGGDEDSGLCNNTSTVGQSKQ